MDITLTQAKQIVERFSQIEDMVQIFDSKISVQTDDEYNHWSIDYTIDELLKENDEDKYVSGIEILYQGGNLNDDDTILDYMTNTLNIDLDSFYIELEMIGGTSWFYLVIH